MLILLVVGVLVECDGFRDDGEVLNALILNSRSRDAFISACVSACVLSYSKLICSTLLLFELVPLLLTAAAILFSEVASANRICVHAYATSLAYGSLLVYLSGLRPKLIHPILFIYGEISYYAHLHTQAHR